MEGYYGIREVFVKVANLEQAAKFYRDLLGFETANASLCGSHRTAGERTAKSRKPNKSRMAQ